VKYVAVVFLHLLTSFICRHFAVGDKVDAKFVDDSNSDFYGAWFKATVTAVHPDDTYDVTWANDDSVSVNSSENILHDVSEEVRSLSEFSVGMYQSTPKNK